MFALPLPPPTETPQESARAPKISVILPPVTPLEAMMDQLEYLANHASGRVCPDNLLGMYETERGRGSPA